MNELLNSRYVSTLEKFGFPEMYAVAALRQTDNDINASMDLIQDKPGEEYYNLFTIFSSGIKTDCCVPNTRVPDYE